MGEVKFNRNQVELLADMVANAEDKAELVNNLAALFAGSTPNFNWGEFKVACGLVLDGSEPVYEELDDDEDGTDRIEWENGRSFYLRKMWGDIALHLIDHNGRDWIILRIGRDGVYRYQGLSREATGLPCNNVFRTVKVARSQ